ncbi:MULTISPECIES: dsDNA nuclease domain-containing protein [unclassified Aeromicrobium]|uniref:dsDNA nuclease domain-containing protein n=1 Tax=unclassified Aeromicrobium TaxID=2633570 RepID=UPI00396B1B0E
MTVVEGGRRARRGFAYQDAVTLLDCLELGTLYSKVSFEDAEDIVCVSLAGDCVIYRQVKTIEGGGRHSAATITSPDKKAKIETSILGKLFTAKPESPLTERFTLLVNEEPQPNLKAFCCDRESTPTPSADEKAVIVEKLDGLTLPNGCTIEQRVDAFEVIVEGRSIEDVEGKLIGKLNAGFLERFGVQFYSDLQEVLDRLLAEVARDARALEPKEWTAADFAALVERIITQVTGRRADGAAEPLPALSRKLEAAGLSEPEIQAQNDAWLRYRREQRSAVGMKLAELNDLSDEVHAVTVEINAQRRAGAIADGAAAYAATMEAMRELSTRLGTSRAKTLQALCDVTARCQNRYRDE